jgi:hypothetical protein
MAVMLAYACLAPVSTTIDVEATSIMSWKTVLRWLLDYKQACSAVLANRV